MARGCTREQMRELDRRAIEDYGIPGEVLMENAGHGAAHIALQMLGEPIGKTVVIFCGKGNNGGDGFVIARHLHNAHVKVHVALACRPEEIHPESEAGINFSIIRRMSLPLLIATDNGGENACAGLTRRADLIVDALFGTGLTGQVREPCLNLIRLINAEDKPVLSVDIPSGLDANTGQVLRAAVRATRTVTFVMPKIGFTLAEGPSHVGLVHVVDIGAPRELVEELLEALES